MESRIPHRAGSLRVLAALVLIVQVGAAPSGRAALRAWTGGGSTAAWSTPANWSPNGAPQDGDDLLFPDGALRQANLNDLPSLSLRSMTFNGTSSYVISGSDVNLSSGISSLNQAGGATINLNVRLTQNQQFTGDNALLILNGGINLAGYNLTLMTATNATIAMGGIISGTGDVIKHGKGGASFGGPAGNTYSGSLLVFEGTFYLGKSGGNAVTGPLGIGDLDNFTFGQVMLTGHNQIADTATITLNHGTLNLNGWNEAVGPMVLYDGNVWTGAGRLTLLGTVTQPRWIYYREVILGTNIYLPADRIFQLNDNDGCYLTGVSGPGGIIVEGIGELFLGGANTFVGPVTVNGGRATLESSSALAGSAGVILNRSGSLGLSDVSIANKIVTINSASAGISGYGVTTWTGPIFLNYTGMAYCNGDTLTFAGPIHGTGGLWFGGYTVELAGSDNNDYSGPTRSACSSLRLNKSNGARPLSGSLDVGGIYFRDYDLDYFFTATNAPAEVRWLRAYQVPGITLTLQANGLVNLNNFFEDFGPVTFNGGEVDTGTGQFGMYAPITVNPADTSAVINGYLGLPPGDNRVFIVGDGPSECDLLVNAVVVGTPNAYVVKQGPGAMCLANANSYDAPTLLEEGILAVSNGSGLGTAVGTIIFDGATLRLGGAGITVAENLEVLGAGVGGTHGAVEVTADSILLLTGEVYLDGSSTFNVGPNAGVTLNGPVFGTGPLIKTGAGSLTFQGTSVNSYSGDTIVREGSLNLAKGSFVTSVPHNLVVGPASADSPAVARHYQAGGMGGDGITVNANSLVDLNGYNQTISQLTLNDGGNMQTRGGTLSFYDGGLIAVGSQSGLGSHASSSISGIIGLPANALFTFNVSAHASTPPLLFTPELDVPASIPGPAESPIGIQAGIAKEGLGRMRLSGNNTYRGPTRVNDGAVIVANAGALGTTAGSTFVNNNATLVIDGGIAILDETLFLNSSHAPALQSLSGSNTWTGPISLGPTATIDVEPANGYLQVPGSVSGPGGITKVGPGTLQFWGTTANTYSGLTTVASGSIDAARANLISIPGDVVIGDDAMSGNVAALRVLREQQLKSIANVTVHGSGGFYLLDTTNSLHPTPQVRTVTGRGLVHVDPLSSLTISNNVSFRFDGLFEGSGSLTKLGSATMQWTGIGSPYSGSAILNAGDFLMNGTAPAMPVTVHSSAALHGDGQVGAVAVFAGGTLGVDSSSPERQGGDLGVKSLLLANGAAVNLDFFGPSPTGGNDQIVASSSVSLGNATFQGAFHYPAREGDVITLLHKTVAGSVSGTFLNWPAGQQQLLGSVPVVINYNGGSGNDVTLTVTNLALNYFTYRLEEGNGNQTVEPDECNLLYVTLLNARSVPLRITKAVLRALTPGALVTIASSQYPEIPVGSGAENLTPFQFRTDPSLPCGGAVSFELILDVAGEDQFAVVVTPFSGTDCTHPTGPCESCTVVSGQFTTNMPTTLQPLYFAGGPSICYPPKACPGVDPDSTLPPMRYQTHSFTNSTTNEVCLTTQLKFDCPAAPTNALGVAAYLNTFDPQQPCAGYLGDMGQGGPPYPPFSFRVPPGSNFLLVVTARATNLVCDHYWLEVFGMPCPPPSLAIAHEIAPAKVRVHWSTAYPGWTAQQEGKISGTFNAVTQPPVIVGGKYAITNITALTNRFYRLKK